MVWSSNFHFKPFSGQTRREREGEREREREHERERKPRSRLQRRRRTSSSSPTIARTRLHAPVWRSHAPVRRSRGSLDRTLQSDDREEAKIARSSPTIDLAFDLAPLDLASARSRLRPINLRPTDLSLWFWFLLLLWWCGSGVLMVMTFDCRSLLSWVELEFRWCVVLGFGCDFEIFCNKICLDAEKIVEKMWKICRKIAFSE